MEAIEWRDVKGYEGLYEVSSAGRIRSLTIRVPNGVGTRIRNGRVLRHNINPRGYATVMLSKDSKQIRLLVSRLVAAAFLGDISGFEIDHVNCNPLDNSLLNLRRATCAQNHGNTRTARTNTSGFKGVSWHKWRGKWRASISIGNRAKHLGRFDTPEEAAQCYALAAAAYHGEFARYA